MKVEMNKHEHEDDAGPHEAAHVKMMVMPAVVANMWSGRKRLAKCHALSHR